METTTSAVSAQWRKSRKTACSDNSGTPYTLYTYIHVRQRYNLGVCHTRLTLLAYGVPQALHIKHSLLPVAVSIIWPSRIPPRTIVSCAVTEQCIICHNERAIILWAVRRIIIKACSLVRCLGVAATDREQCGEVSI